MRNLLRFSGFYMLLSLRLVSLAVGSNTPSPNSDPDWTQASAQVQKVLDGNPIALLARVQTGYAPGATGGVTVKWAVGDDQAMVRESDSGAAAPKVIHLNPAVVRSIREKLKDPGLIKQIHDLPGRTTIPPDADYWILFLQIGSEQIVLRSWHPDAIVSVSKAMHIDEEQAARQLGAEYRPMIECWAKIERVFDPILYGEDPGPWRGHEQGEAKPSAK